MTKDGETRSGSCACGSVRLLATGAPERSGLCHCLTCQKTHAAPFFPFVVFRRAQLEVSGAVVSYETSPGYDRAFCAVCGAHAYTPSGEWVEVSSCVFDDLSAFPPQYESWVVRRRPWLRPLDVPQYERNRGEDD